MCIPARWVGLVCTRAAVHLDVSGLARRPGLALVGGMRPVEDLAQRGISSSIRKIRERRIPAERSVSPGSRHALRARRPRPSAPSPHPSSPRPLAGRPPHAPPAPRRPARCETTAINPLTETTPADYRCATNHTRSGRALIRGAHRRLEGVGVHRLVLGAIVAAREKL